MVEGSAHRFPCGIADGYCTRGGACFFSTCDAVEASRYGLFLPLENKLGMYIKQSLRWTFFAQLPLPFLLYIVALPLLSATGTGSKVEFIGIAALMLFVKWVFVVTEYNFRHALEGRNIWGDRVIRFVLAGLLIFNGLVGSWLLFVVLGVLLGLYSFHWATQKKEKPFPYDHFIELEQNRMMRFYRFANYFTDVPHLKGSVSRRGWIGMLFDTPKFGQTVPQAYLVRRTFIRTDDIFGYG